MLAAAADTLAATSGVDLTLSTDDLPEGVSGITEADGIATNAPAFEGTITVIFAGQSVDVPGHRRRRGGLRPAAVHDRLPGHRPR